MSESLHRELLPEVNPPRHDLDTMFLDMLTDNLSRMPNGQLRLDYALGQIEYIGTLGVDGEKLVYSLRVLQQEREKLRELLGATT